MSEHPPDIEADFLTRLADIGLVVPARDPARPHTKTELRCGKAGAVGLPRLDAPGRDGGRPVHWNPRCRSWGCPNGIEDRARWATMQVNPREKAFVGVTAVYRNSSSYGCNSDKWPLGSLWVTTVPVMPAEVRSVRERVTRRFERLVHEGQLVECVIVPCDGMVVVVSSSDLAEVKSRGRRCLPPSTGYWLSQELARAYLQATLASTAANGRIFWSDGWRPAKPPSRLHSLTGDAFVTKTAYSILVSEGYRYEQGNGWWQDDPLDVLQDAKRRAETFWAEPACSACAASIARDDKFWWRQGHAFCSVCDLAFDLLDVMTIGRTEREIEASLAPRRLTVRRNRALIEQALAHLGATRAPNGIWVPRPAGEEAA